MLGCEIRNASARRMRLTFWVMLNSFGLKANTSEPGNFKDNACAESFFSLLKKNELDVAYT
jgi:hypothetical protein